MTLEVEANDSETALTTETVKVPLLACVSWARENEEAGLYHHADPKCKQHVVRALERKLIIGHTISYDTAVWWRQWPDLVSLIWECYADGRIVDIRLAQKLADISDGKHEKTAWASYSLNALCKHHLGRELDKDTWRLEYGTLRDLPLHAWPEGARQYPIADAVGTLACWFEIRDKYGIAATGDVVRQTRHNFAVHLLEVAGLRTDPEIVELIRDRTSTELETLVIPRLLRNGLLRWEGPRANPRRDLVKSTKVAADLMRLTCPEELKRATKGGAKKLKESLVSSVDDVICCDKEACEDSGNPLLEAYAHYQHLDTFLTRHAPKLAAGVIHCKFESLRDTGRIASGGGDAGYNATNMPQGEKDVLGVRECFVPRDLSPDLSWLGARRGPKVLISVDYPGLELHTIAQMCLDLYGRSDMAKALTSKPKRNLHTMFGAYLLKIPYEEGVQRKKAQEHLFLRMYEVAKRCNFGLGGGMGVARFVATCKKERVLITLDEAKAFIAAWRQFWPEMELHFQRARSLTGSFNSPKLARIKHLRVDRWRGGLNYMKVCNTPFQGLGADCAKDSLFDVSRACYDPAMHSPLFGSVPVNFPHDDIETETPLEGAHEAAVEQARIMNETANKFLVDVPIESEPALAMRFSKYAQTIYDAHGRLVPWEHAEILKRGAA